MKQRIQTNKIEAKINYTLLDKDFEVFKISTDDKYIKHGASILDFPDKIKVESIFFESGKSLYVLAKRADNCFEMIKGFLIDGEHTGSYYLERVPFLELKPYSILQLLYNSLNNVDHKLLKFNNLTGKLYCTIPEFMSKYHIITVEVKITYDMCLTLPVKTFTIGTLKNRMSFPKLKFHDYPQYTLAENNAMRRVMKSEDLPLDKIYINRQIDGQKSNVTYLDISNYDNFKRSKLGIYAEVIKLFNERFNDYVKIDFFSEYDFKAVEFDANSKKISEANIKKIVEENRIHIIDQINDSTTEEFTKEIANMIFDEFGIRASIGKRPKKDKLNINLIHKKEIYEGVDDRYIVSNDDCIVQNITLENFSLDKFSLTNIIKQLVIKKDIGERRISVVDWDRYNYTGNWIFGMEDTENKLFYFMTIYPDGKFEFKRLANDLFSNDEYSKYYEYFVNGKKSISGVIIAPNGKVNCIKDTDWFTVPEFSDLGDIFSLTTQHRTFSRDLIIGYLEQYPKRDSVGDIITKINEYFEENDSINNNTLDRLLSNRGLREFVNQKITEETNIPLRPYLRNRSSVEEYLMSVTDIKYFGESDNVKYYFVGYIAKGLRGAMPHSCVIRQVYSPENNGIFFDELLPLMNVTFVQNNRLTVLPFPFKYLREYIYRTQDHKNAL